MPDVDGIEAACLIYRERPVPVILVSSYFDTQLMERAETAPIQSYLVKPIKLTDLEPALHLARRRFEQLQALQKALARVKQLQGLLPICMYCKKIRDDRDYWQQVEAYIARHSEARFSHGISPDCYESVVKPELEERRRRWEALPEPPDQPRTRPPDNRVGP
jgi:YesN/AraC family two-component response regulator